MLQANYVEIRQAIKRGKGVPKDLVQLVKDIKIKGDYNRKIDELIRLACDVENLPALTTLLYDGSESQDIFLQMGSCTNTIYIYANDVTRDDSYLIHYLAQQSKNKALALLLQHMPNLFVLDRNGDTILASAIRAENVAGIKIIMEKFPELAQWKTHPCNLVTQQTIPAVELVDRLARRAKFFKTEIYTEMKSALAPKSNLSEEKISENQASKEVTAEDRKRKISSNSSLLISFSSFKRKVTEDKTEKPKRKLVVIKKQR
ncbi:MAG: ankyrin repeat domain-containing protein [Gammaproteobacteria bacterium]